MILRMFFCVKKNVVISGLDLWQIEMNHKGTYQEHINENIDILYFPLGLCNTYLYYIYY